MNIREAKSIAFGSRRAESLESYYDAWQWLYDNKVLLGPEDELYLEKLICDGNVLPQEGYFD